MNIHTITNNCGVLFNVVVLLKGDTYGLNKCLTHDGDEPLVEFYDARYPHDAEGQFVSRYYASTLFEDWDRLTAGGLDLQSDVPAWKIDGPAMREALNFAHSIVARS